MTVTKMWCILSLAYNRAFDQVLFESREDKDKTPAECTSRAPERFLERSV
jgi:hypothetical protein